MCLRPYHLKYQTFDGSWRESDVPCGKCPECIRRAQSDMMILCARQLQAATGSSWFVTLSYKDADLPLAYVCTCYDYGRPLNPHEVDILAQDRTNWRVVDRSKPVRLSRAPFRTHSSFDDIVCHPGEKWSEAVKIPGRLEAREAAIREEYGRRFRWNGVKGSIPWSPSPSFIGNCIKPGCVLELARWIEHGCIYIVTVACSVDRKDVQLWLKNSRVAYERKFGHKLPDFSYVFVQEYGPRGHRPHYHMIFSNIEESDLVWVLTRWSSKYCGDPRPRRKRGAGVVYDKILRVTEKGNDGCVSAGRYLGCYIKKLAAHDDKAMVSGLCAKPRKCSSKFFGVGKDFEKLRSYLLGFDVFGAYDVNDPSSYETFIEELFDVVKRRQSYRLPVNSNKQLILAIPDYLKRKIYKGEKVKETYRKVPTPFTPLSFDSYCESSGFGSVSYRYERTLVRYPASSALSQGLADLEAFRASLLLQEELYAFAGERYDPLDLPAYFPPEVLVQFADAKARANREKWSDMRDQLKVKYTTSKF